MSKNGESEITAQVETALDSAAPIGAADVVKWMGARSLETWGALSLLLFQHNARVQPPLTLMAVCDFRRAYYRRCLTEANEAGKYYPSKYIAGHELQNWFRTLWEDQTVPRKYLSDLKTMLTELYLSGDSELRECVVVSVLEHLFEIPAIARYFSDWRNNPTLQAGYESAMEWAEGHSENG